MFGRPDAAAGQRWLASQNLASHAKWLPFFGHAPLAVAEAARTGRLKALESLVADLMKPQDPLAQAARWESLVKSDAVLGMEELVTTIQKWLLDLQHSQAGAEPRYFHGSDNLLGNLARKASPAALAQAQQQVGQLRAWAGHPLNPRLFLEDLCVRAYRPLGL